MILSHKIGDGLDGVWGFGGDEVGALAAGQRANFFTTKTPNAIQAIPYFMGQNHCHQVFVNGSPFQ